MANRVLNSEERVNLASHVPFQNRVKQAVRDAGDYWANHDQTNLTGNLADRIKWAKNRINGVQIVLNDAYVSNPDLPLRALKASKGSEYNLPAETQTPEQLMAVFIEPNFESMASLLMDVFGEDINMTIGGN